MSGTQTKDHAQCALIKVPLTLIFVCLQAGITADSMEKRNIGLLSISSLHLSISRSFYRIDVTDILWNRTHLI